MKKEENIPHTFESLFDLHRVLGLPKPLHPLISLVENKDNEIDSSKYLLIDELKTGQSLPSPLI